MSKVSDSKEPDILYRCDGKACGEVCPNPECKHTKDINHAVNFKRYDDSQGTYFVELDWEANK